MDAYPQDYIARNFPFVVFSGFDADIADDDHGNVNAILSDDGVLVDSEWPTVANEQSSQLLEKLMSCNAAADAIPSRTGSTNDSTPRFHFEVKGRVGMLYLSCY